MRKFILGVLVATSAIPGGSASAEPCVVWDPPPPHVEFDCLADATSGLEPVICAAFQTAGMPAVVNALAPTLGMDADDCDMYVNGERFIDFVPYED